MEEQADTPDVNVGRYPFVEDLDKKLFLQIPELMSIRTAGEARVLIERHTGMKATSFQIMKMWTYSRLADYDGLAFPSVVNDE